MLNKNIKNLEQKIDVLSRRCDIIEKDAYLSNRILEYKLWQLNTFNNIFLYQLSLKDKNKRPNFHPLVSIIIPVYNGSNYLSKAIESAINQTYDNTEIIIINDGSTDDGASAAIAKRYGKKILYYEKENGGVSTALNYGISKMHGEYFAWLSHDDLIDSTHIEHLVNHISYEENKDEIPFSGFKIIDEHGRINLDITVASQLHCYDFKISYFKNELSLLQGEINGGSILIPKTAFKKCGLFDESQRITQERDMWVRLLKYYHLINIPFDTASIRLHSKQVTNTNKDVKKKTDQYNQKIIANLSDATAVSLFGSKENLLLHLRRFYANNSNIEMMEAIDLMLSKL